MKNERPNVPRTMENCLIDGKCDSCRASFDGRTEIWTWNEYTCCSKACVVKAKNAGDTEYSSLHPHDVRATIDSKEKDTELL